MPQYIYPNTPTSITNTNTLKLQVTEEINQSSVLQINFDNAILRPGTPGVKIPAQMPRYRTDATVPTPAITDTTAKDTSIAVTQAVNGDTTNIMIIINLMTCTAKRWLNPDEVLERSKSLLVTQVPDR